ncbi:MAG: hypothetical protein K0S54_1081 [Alphaproteobacteria bacterium]|jgi:hypothetical protein|nr:hypothetical protein [Alphaproteobacteria bacterium]
MTPFQRHPRDPEAHRATASDGLNRKWGFPRALRVLRRLLSQENGNTLMVVAASMPAVMMSLGLGVEGGMMYLLRRQAQTAADAAAISGGMELVRGQHAAVTGAGRAASAANGFTNGGVVSVAVNNPPEQGTYATDPAAVEAVVSRPHPLLFASLFNAVDPMISARAVAKVHVAGEACVLALRPNAIRGVETSGSASVNLQGCTLAANTKSSSALYMSGSGALYAESLWSAGGIYISGSSSTQFEQPPMEYMWPLPDPYASLPIPTGGGCTTTNASYSAATVTINPGVYCGGISFGSGANVTLNPGTYYVRDGNFNVKAQAVVKGTGVTIILTGTTASTVGAVDINANTDVTLSAPTGSSDTYRGLTFVQQRNGTADSKFNGGSRTKISGGIYFPNTRVTWNGDNTYAAPDCTQVVAAVVTFTGNTTLNNAGCKVRGVKPVSVDLVRLVE